MYECCSCEAYINKWSKPYWFNLLDVIFPQTWKLTYYASYFWVLAFMLPPHHLGPYNLGILSLMK